jgi:AcrR family transcriptional regulator
MSPRRAEQNQAMREESRSRIIDAALRLFAGYGYERATVRMIAEAAGVAQGLMYSHFASKEELLRAIFEQSVADVYASFALAAAGAPGPPTVERIIRGAFAILRERRDFWHLSYGVRMQPEVLAAIGDALPAWTASIRQTLEQALVASEVERPAIEADLLFAAIDGVAQHYTLDPERYPLDEVVEALIARYQRA